MPKICDPPAFTGGQLANTNYWVTFETYTDIYGYPFRYLSTYTIQLTGKITGSGHRRRDAYPYMYDAILIYTTYYTNGYSFTELGWYYREDLRTEVIITNIVRVDGLPDSPDNPPSTNCYCSNDSCRVDCASSPNGFCCIDHSVPNRLLQVLAAS